METNWVLKVKELNVSFVVLEGQSGQYFVSRHAAYVPSYMNVGDTVRLENAVHFGRARLSCQIIPNQEIEAVVDADELPLGLVSQVIIYEHCAPLIG